MNEAERSEFVTTVCAIERLLVVRGSRYELAGVAWYMGDGALGHFIFDSYHGSLNIFVRTNDDKCTVVSEDEVLAKAATRGYLVLYTLADASSPAREAAAAPEAVVMPAGELEPVLFNSRLCQTRPTSM